MKIIAIIVGKITIFFGNILHRGSSLPGKMALKVDKKLLSKLKYPNIKIAVTGSSGKGSTSYLIASTLKKNNYKVCFNSAGSNLAWGITSSFLRNCSLTGKIKTDALVIEVDERYTKEVFAYLHPTHIVVTNLTKDQPPRQGNVDIVYDDVLKSINKEAKVITNMDEPYMRNFERDTDNQIVYFSIAKNNESYQENLFENLNTYYCPYCGGKLEYEYYNFETLGKYNCPNCNFQYETPGIIGNNLNLENGTITINNEEILIGGDMLYNAYNTVAAYTTLSTLNLEPNKISASLNKFNNVSNKTFTNNKKVFYGMSSKAENCTTFNQAIFKIISDSRKKDIIIGWKEISRRYEHFDVSWLYDIEFELLNNDDTLNFYVCGIDKHNLKKRLILAGINENKIIMAYSIPEIKDQVLNSESEIVYGVLNFDYVEIFTNTFEEDKKC